MVYSPSQKDLDDFALALECEIIPQLKHAGFERNKYNVFDILRLNRQELRHSEFLAFLLNPDLSEDIGVQFLKHFLIVISDKVNLSKSDILKYEFEKITVRREYKHVDILADIRIKTSENILIVIENKIDSRERIGNSTDDGQLQVYRRTIESEYGNKNYKIIYLFLSPNNRNPKKDSEYWIPIDYRAVYDALYGLDIDNANNTLKTLITDYIKMIRSEFNMTDTATEQQAISLYIKYHDVFDFIFKHKPDRINETANTIHKMIEAEDWLIQTGKNDNIKNIWFTTKELYEFWRGSFKIYFMFQTEDLSLICFVEQANDRTRRLLNYQKESATFRYGGKQWLFENNSKTKEKIEEHEEYILNNDTEQLKNEIQTAFVEWLKRPNGWIAQKSTEICNLLGEI